MLPHSYIDGCYPTLTSMDVTSLSHRWMLSHSHIDRCYPTPTSMDVTSLPHRWMLPHSYFTAPHSYLVRLSDPCWSCSICESYSESFPFLCVDSPLSTLFHRPFETSHMAYGICEGSIGQGREGKYRLPYRLPKQVCLFVCCLFELYG